MKIKNRLFVLLTLLIAFSLVLCACASGDNTSSAASEASSTADESSSASSNGEISEESAEISDTSSEASAEVSSEVSAEVSDEISSEISDETSQGEVNEVNYGLSIKMPSGRALRIAQFADLHFGIEGKDYNNDKEQRTREYMAYVAENGKPDLIVCSGDNVLSTGVSGLKEFISLMESLNTPWTMIYGNHDAEYNTAGFSKKELNDYLLSCGAKHLIYAEGYSDASANRYGNFSISILNTAGNKLLGALVLIDSGKYSSDLKDYESVTKGEIDWYKSEIDRLQAIYKAQSNNKYDIIPTVVFSHIQLPEYFTAYNEALKGGEAKFVIKQELSSADIEDLRTGGPVKENTGFFSALLEKKSTKAYFVGHAHTFNWQAIYKGILLGFGPQTGFSKLFVDNDLARTTYIYNLSDDFSIKTEACKEQPISLGLAFCGTYDGVAQLDKTSGKYTFTGDFELWNRIQFSFNGERLTTSNTTFTGCFNNSGAATWDEKFYTTDSKTFIYSASKVRNYTFTYDPKAKTLDISVNESEVPEDYSKFKADKLNADSGADSISVWTNAGTKLRTVASDGTVSWVGNGWRYYIVVDADGRIAYAVKYPPNGYGGPTGSGYYCHSIYSDPAKNPAFILNGDNWEVVIPKGGFAITAHGSAVATITNALSGGTLLDVSDAKVNKRGVFDDAIRLSFDPATGFVNVTK